MFDYFVPAFTDVDAVDVAATGLSTGWQVIVGASAGVALVVLALVLGAWFQRRSSLRDDERKARLRSEAEVTGAVTFTELDLSDGGDFDLGVPTPPAAIPPVDIPEYL